VKAAHPGNANDRRRHPALPTLGPLRTGPHNVRPTIIAEASQIATIQSQVGNAAVSRFLTNTGQLHPGSIDTPYLQRKSPIVADSHGSADTPLVTLHNTLGNYYQTAGVPDYYHFDGLHPLKHDAGTYNLNFLRAKKMTAQIDPKSKANGGDRNNFIIGPYGHLGVMERSIFGRPNRGNHYDGGHLVEHTLMEGFDGSPLAG
jgi:hypothetical protein